MYCSNCGQYNNNNASYCTNCGSSLGTHIDSTNSNYSNSKGSYVNTRHSKNSYNGSNDLNLFGVDYQSEVSVKKENKFTKYLFNSCILFSIFIITLFSTRLFNINMYHAPDILTIIAMLSLFASIIFAGIDLYKYVPDRKGLAVAITIVAIIAMFAGDITQYVIIIYYCYRFFNKSSINSKIVFVVLTLILAVTNLYLKDKVFVDYNNEKILMSVEKAKSNGLEVAYRDLFSNENNSYVYDSSVSTSNEVKDEYKESENTYDNSDIVDNEKKDSLVMDNIVNMGSYNYITVKDLDVYSSDIVGKQVLIIDTISSISTSSDTNDIQILVPDTYHDMNCYIASDSSVDLDKLSSHNYVAIVGIVDNPTDAYFFKSPNLISCYVIAYGDDAYSLYTKYTETSAELSTFFTSQSTVSEDSDYTDTSDLSESDFKSSCETIDVSSYNDILRNPDSYKKNVKFTGVVDQTLEGWFGSYTLYIKDTNGNKWGITYRYKGGESHKLEGDSVTVYGLLDGTQTTETVLGKQVTLPYISADYIE